MLPGLTSVWTQGEEMLGWASSPEDRQLVGCRQEQIWVCVTW